MNNLSSLSSYTNAQKGTHELEKINTSCVRATNDGQIGEEKSRNDTQCGVARTTMEEYTLEREKLFNEGDEIHVFFIRQSRRTVYSKVAKYNG